jgi:error-prone DNA polymerase
LKCHHPAAFAAGLLNAQPMGFYAPAQIVRDAREHGVEVRSVDVNASNWDATLEADTTGAGLALRLGLRQVEGLVEAEAEKIVRARAGPAAAGAAEVALRPRPFRDPQDLLLRARLRSDTLERLAAADTMRSMGIDRRQARGAVKGLVAAPPLPLFAWHAASGVGDERAVVLPKLPLSEHVVNDYQTLRLSLKAHPMSFLRADLRMERVSACCDLQDMRDGARVAVAGVILVRQRPGSAKGVVFMTIEDETGIANAVVWPKTLERYRRVVMGARLVLVHGRIQRHASIIHVVADRLEDRSAWLARLVEDAGEIMPIPIANADEVLRPEPGSARSRTKDTRSAGPPPKTESAMGPGRNAAAGAGGATSAPRHPRLVRVIPRSRDFH